jgi:16S rRNA (guanine966-N2)-methyltransferase
MRIIGGRRRGHRLTAPAGAWLRPSADRTRETLFNILAHAAFGGPELIEGAEVLDAFAGTGALGLEALSRGARFVTFIEKSAKAIGVIERNARALDESDRIACLKTDATRPPRAPGPCGLVFMDPPYSEGLAEATLGALAAGGWFAPQAVIVVERAKGEAFAPPPGFALVSERRSGPAVLAFLRYERAESPA